MGLEADRGLAVAAQKTANEVTEYVRKKLREDGFVRKIMPPVLITDDELDRSVSARGPDGKPLLTFTLQGLFS